MSTNRKGFTLIELLVVIAIIGILVAIIFVALDPAARFGQARDSVRQNDVQEILSAIKLYQVDNGGDHLLSIQAMAVGEVYMLTRGMTSGCDDNNDNCDTNVTGDGFCLNINTLITDGYIEDVPYSPSGNVGWDHADTNTDEGTGYTLWVDSSGLVKVRACESEQTDIEIYASR
jgi:prepilin-type N-terminal cleavage/methylation domain-containing protein